MYEALRCSSNSPAGSNLAGLLLCRVEHTLAACAYDCVIEPALIEHRLDEKVRGRQKFAKYDGKTATAYG